MDLYLFLKNYNVKYFWITLYRIFLDNDYYQTNDFF